MDLRTLEQVDKEWFGVTYVVRSEMSRAGLPEGRTAIQKLDNLLDKYCMCQDTAVRFEALARLKKYRGQFIAELIPYDEISTIFDERAESQTK